MVEAGSIGLGLARQNSALNLLTTPRYARMCLVIAGFCRLISVKTLKTKVFEQMLKTETSKISNSAGISTCLSKVQ